MGCVERETVAKLNKAHTQDKFTFVELKAFFAQHIDFDKAVRWNAKYWKFGILRWQNFLWFQSGEVCEKDLYKSKKTITESGLKNSSAKIFPKNTVLMAMYGSTAGQVGIFES